MFNQTPPCGVFFRTYSFFTIPYSLKCLSPWDCISAVYFCCTFLKVAFTGSYPAPCPVELGLSSLTHSAPATAQLAQSALYINFTQKSKDFYSQWIQKLLSQKISPRASFSKAQKQSFPSHNGLFRYILHHFPERTKFRDDPYRP